MSGHPRPGSSNGNGDPRAATEPRSAGADDQSSLEIDQALSDADQAASDTEQATADVDQSQSERDGALSVADQDASDKDQAAADRDLIEARPVGTGRQQAHDLSKVERQTITTQRDANAVRRAQTTEERLDAADRRDEASRLRDLAAEARDRAADVYDRQVAQTEPVGPGAEARARAAAERALAAADRERAAADRKRVARDREQIRAALEDAHIDELTGTYRRGLGTIILQREVNRARHSGGDLVLGFVDVDGLKAVNDSDGHAAGDAFLVDVVSTIRSKLRSYDPIVRFGGDEFVCAFSDFSLGGVRRRFQEIQSALDQRRPGCSISVGLAELQRNDTLDELTARGDAALYEQKRLRREDEGSCRP